jgi:hypothetical protein
MDNLISRVWEYAQNNPDGFTLNIETMKPVKFGIIAAHKATQNSFGKQSLENVISHALENDKIIGGWLNAENEMFYFDSCKIFSNKELQKAIEFANENDQIAIYDLTNGREIKL